MKIIHRVSFHPKIHRTAAKKFLKLGIALKESSGDPKYSLGCYFDISEDDPLWPEVEKVLSSAGIHTVPDTEFTKEEIMSAEWVRIYPSHFCGYPMPKNHGEWRDLSYTSENECKVCGIELRQKAPIHLKGEPKMGRNHFMGIFWMYNIFAQNKIFDILSQSGITGYEEYPAIHYKKKIALKTIKQLKVFDDLAPGIIDDNLTRENYSCGHIKYIGLSRGMYKFTRKTFENVSDLMKTYEWFGTGGAASQLILASAKFVKVYMENNWRGLNLAPIELI